MVGPVLPVGVEFAQAYSGPSDTAALTYVEQRADVCVSQSLQEGLAVEP
ncbi:hypothetical protein J7I98_25960 [Streptomyces sp. ISL-98]|nr:hypothetical protein [Streptomyces sp. ISL-98]MBT2509261.1 hypothetical protein [Streptomyces sp. ISL-98]